MKILQNRFLRFLALGLMIYFCSSCSRHYGHPMIGNQTYYLAQPLADTSQIYATSDFVMNTGYNKKEGNYCITPGVHRSHTFSFSSISYGTFGYGGLYDVKGIPEENGYKSYFGLGARGGGNIHIGNESATWRIIGVEAAISQEFGSYRQFRNKYAGIETDSIEVYHLNGIANSISFTTELLLHHYGNKDRYSSFKITYNGGILNNLGYIHFTAAGKYANMLVFLNIMVGGKFGQSPFPRSGISLGIQFLLN